MKLCKINCAFCEKEFFRTSGRINEAKKFGWKQYCSLTCHSLAKNKQKTLKCGNLNCNKIFERRLKEVPLSGICFCSHSCAAIITNPLRRKVKTCGLCSKQYSGENKYCSDACRLRVSKTPRITKEQIIKKIKEFHGREERIPLKKEFFNYKAARLRFGSWNKAIKAAGFEPNPVMFAKKYIANDGHKCDSLAEKIIDDWFFARKIEHDIHVPYPSYPRLTCDFVISNHFIEFFGLEGEHKRYTELVKQKRKIAKKLKLKFLEVKPEHLFPENRLTQVLGFLSTI